LSNDSIFLTEAHNEKLYKGEPRNRLNKSVMIPLKEL